MSYSEKDGQVILTLGWVDYDELVARVLRLRTDNGCALLDRIHNAGNPHYTPYRAEEKKP